MNRCKRMVNMALKSPRIVRKRLPFGKRKKQLGSNENTPCNSQSLSSDEEVICKTPKVSLECSSNNSLDQSESFTPSSLSKEPVRSESHTSDRVTSILTSDLTPDSVMSESLTSIRGISTPLSGLSFRSEGLESGPSEQITVTPLSSRTSRSKGLKSGTSKQIIVTSFSSGTSRSEGQELGPSERIFVTPLRSQISRISEGIESDPANEVTSTPKSSQTLSSEGPLSSTSVPSNNQNNGRSDTEIKNSVPGNDQNKERNDTEIRNLVAGNEQDNQSTQPQRTLITSTANPKQTGRKWLRQKLSETTNGRMVLGFYEEHKYLDKTNRKDLAKILIHDELEADPSKIISAQRYMELTSSIIEAFPTEIAETYFIRYYKEASGSKKKKHAPKGLLYDKFNYRRKELIKRKVVHKHQSPQVRVSFEESDTSIEDNFSQETKEKTQHLKNYSEPLEDIIKGCEETHKYRMHLYFTSNQTPLEFLVTFPAFVKENGYLLIDLDFRIANGDGTANALLTKWTDLKKKVISHTERRLLHDKSLSLLIQSFKIDLTLKDEKTTDLNGFLLVPALLSVAPVKKNFRPSKLEAKNGFIIQAVSKEDAKKVIDERNARLLQFGLDVPPSVVVLGEIPNCTYLIIWKESIEWKFETITKAIDTCFKLYVLFRMEFPLDSLICWRFLKDYVYGFHSLVKYPQLATLANELSLQ